MSSRATCSPTRSRDWGFDGSGDQIIPGPDGNIWFIQAQVADIGEITPAGAITEYPLPSSDDPSSIVVGPDGNIWFTDVDGGQIGVMSTTGVLLDEYLVPLPPGSSYDGFLGGAITVGPDQNLYFTLWPGYIGEITTSGTITEIPIPDTIPTKTGSPPDATVITSGPDGNIWFTVSNADTDTDAYPDADAHSDSHADTNAHSDTNTDARSDTNAYADSNACPYIESEPDTDAESDSGTDAHAGAAADSGKLRFKDGLDYEREDRDVRPSKNSDRYGESRRQDSRNASRQRHLHRWSDDPRHRQAARWESQNHDRLRCRSAATRFRLFTVAQNLASSTSAVRIETIKADRALIQFTISPSHALSGQVIALRARVTRVGAGAGMPSGKVTFWDGTTVLGTTIIAGSDATLLTDALSVGIHHLRAVYAGSDSYAPASSRTRSANII